MIRKTARGVEMGRRVMVWRGSGKGGEEICIIHTEEWYALPLTKSKCVIVTHCSSSHTGGSCHYSGVVALISTIVMTGSQVVYNCALSSAAAKPRLPRLPQPSLHFFYQPLCVLIAWQLIERLEYYGEQSAAAPYWS
jgi:hypothetical protein